MIIYFVVLVSLAWLPQTTLSFSFTRKPEQPMVIVLNNNSTNVVFRWEVNLASNDVFTYLNFKRYEKDKGLGSSGVTLGYYEPGFTDVNTTLYSLHTNVSKYGPSSGYVSFTIKDIMKQTNNKDGSTADARSINYFYQLEMKMRNILNAAVSDVEMRLLVKVNNFIGPKNVSVNESGQLNVACSADGKPTPTLTVLLPNGVEIKGNKTLDVNITAYRNMTGMYTCTAENEVTSPQTKRAWLNVLSSPIITSPNHSNVTLNESNTARLVCKAEGNPEPDITWTKDGVQVGNESTYITPVVTRYDHGQCYICKASNGFGEDKMASVCLNVQFSPNITRPYHSNVTVNESNTARLVCKAEGNPEPDITWTKNGVQVGNESTYISPVVTRYDHKQCYICKASNGFGEDRNVSVCLNVQYSPGMPQTFIAQPANACSDGLINLTCSNSDANPVVSKYFFYNGAKLLEEAGNGFFQTNKTIVGKNVLWCVPFNGIGKGQNISATVIVHENPTILKPRINDAPTTNEAITVVKDTKLELTFFYNGTRNLTVGWKRYDGKPSRGQSFKQAFTYGLNFSLAHRDDSGVYEMIARDDYGCFTVKSFNLIVHFSATCSISPIDVREGNSVTLNISTSGNPPVNDYICTHPNGSRLAGNGVFTFPASQRDAGTYHCSVYNGIVKRGNCTGNVNVQWKMEGHLKLDRNWNENYSDKNSVEFKVLESNMIRELRKIYNNTSLRSVEVHNCIRGSVLVNFILYFTAKDGSLQPLIKAVNMGLIINGSSVQKGSVNSGFLQGPPTTQAPTLTRVPTTTPTKTTPTSDDTTVIIISIVAALIFLFLILILCYCKKKRSKKNGKGHKEAEAIPLDDEVALRNNQGNSPSNYADRGPSHTNPAFDHSVGVPKVNTNNYSDQTESVKEKEEPAYAAVDIKKKTNKKNPEELTYAKLEDFEKNGTQPKGSHDSIVLEPQLKGKNTKMPEKYKETIYAEIVGTKKQGGDNQGDGAADASLNDLHNKDAEVEKQPSGGNPGTAEEKEQRTAVAERENSIPPLNQQEQPQTKDDTGKMKPETKGNLVTKLC